jgi:hypothetical protein
MGVRFVGVWLVFVGRSDCDDLLFCAVGVAVTCGRFDAGSRAAAVGFCGVLTVGSGRSGISGSDGSPERGEESAVVQLASLDLVDVSAVGVGCCSDTLADVNKPKTRRKSS